MKTLIRFLTGVVLCSSLFTLRAQPGPGGGSPGPDLSGAMSKLFGDHKAFTAGTEMQIKSARSDEPMTMSGKMAYLDGKSRFELDVTQMAGGKLPPGAAEQMKQMGMDKIVMISLPDKKLAYAIYPTLKAYAEMPTPNAEKSGDATNFDLKISELGKETLDGHACVKNKATVTDKEGKTHEFTVWNATDLKKFPLKIETEERNSTVVILFKDVKFAKPAADQFEAPSDYKKYENMMALMQQEMMKRMNVPEPQR